MIVVVTREAEADLERIGDYIAADDPRRALSFVAELVECCAGLVQMPERFPLVPRYAENGIRRRVHGNYIVFYRIASDRVEILHILNGAQDYGAILFPSA